MLQAQEMSVGHQADNRNRNMGPFTLIEIDRANVVDQIRGSDMHVAESIFATGPMRELCPHCMTNHLKLVLRQKRVRHAHLFCQSCNRCFDARYPNGSSALSLDE
jgi:hypothetical protein